MRYLAGLLFLFVVHLTNVGFAQTLTSAASSSRPAPSATASALASPAPSTSSGAPAASSVPAPFASTATGGAFEVTVGGTTIKANDFPWWLWLVFVGLVGGAVFLVAHAITRIESSSSGAGLGFLAAAGILLAVGGGLVSRAIFPGETRVVEKQVMVPPTGPMPVANASDTAVIDAISKLSGRLDRFENEADTGRDRLDRFEKQATAARSVTFAFMDIYSVSMVALMILMFLGMGLLVLHRRVESISRNQSRLLGREEGRMGKYGFVPDP